MRMIFAVLFIGLMSGSDALAQQNFGRFTAHFVDGYKALDIPTMSLSYVENLQHVKSLSDISKEVAFFNSVRRSLPSYQLNKLTIAQRLDFRLIRYETDQNLRRLYLEKKWRLHHLDTISDKGLQNLPGGKQWYLYYLNAWLNDNIAPEKIFVAGLRDVARANRRIDSIRKITGLDEKQFYAHLNDKDFFSTDTVAIQNYFLSAKLIIEQHLSKLFNQHGIPPLVIRRSTNPARSQAPGYYDNSVFYYCMQDQPYNKRQINWLFIHEAIPGHHYKMSINAAAKKSQVQELFFYPGFEEGWAAYTEELGKDLGLYRTPYDELGKWEWDIVRSIRVPMDIGINYYGWTDVQALAFWRAHVKNQDNIAMREIARVKRWPAQAITYKYGCWQIMKWKEDLKKKQGRRFDIRNFHDRILNSGSSPIPIIKINVMK